MDTKTNLTARLLKVAEGGLDLAARLLKEAERRDADEAWKCQRERMDPNVKTADGSTPLHLAVKAGHIEMTTLLPGFEALVNLVDVTGATPLHYAALHGHDTITRVLLAYRAKPNIKDNSGMTALHRATQGSHLFIVEKLLEHGADVYAQDNAGLTALHIAVQRSDVDAVKLLIENGTDQNSEDELESTPPSFAVAGNVVTLLPSEKPKLELQVPDGLSYSDWLDAVTKRWDLFSMTINEVTLSPPPLPARDASKTNYVVIRTWGELSRSKIKRLNSAGFDHFDCVSKDTFLCRYLAKDLDKLRNNKAIVFADIYHSEFKISPPLRRAHPDHYYEVDIIYHKGVSDSPKLRVHISVASHTRVIKFSENKARLTTLARYLDEIALVDEVRYIERAAKTIPQNGGALELGVNDWIPTLAELHHYPDFDLS